MSSYHAHGNLHMNFIKKGTWDGKGQEWSLGGWKEDDGGGRKDKREKVMGEKVIGNAEGWVEERKVVEKKMAFDKKEETKS